MAYELSDNSYAQGNHAADMLMVYLPKEKFLINADLYSPPAIGAGKQRSDTMGECKPELDSAGSAFRDSAFRGATCADRG